MTFDTFDLITHAEPVELDSSPSTSNPPKVMIVLSSEEDKDLRTGLLPKILQAVKIDIKKEAITLIKEHVTINILNQLKDLKIDKVILFGVKPIELSLNLNPRLYQLIEISNIQFLFSDSLSIIASNKERKKALWTNLQLIFPNN